MGLSFIAFVGLIALGSNLGAQARAIPNELYPSSRTYTREVDTFTDENVKH
jgi:hypothetical protein